MSIKLIRNARFSVFPKIDISKKPLPDEIIHIVDAICSDCRCTDFYQDDDKPNLLKCASCFKIKEMR